MSIKKSPVSPAAMRKAGGAPANLKMPVTGSIKGSTSTSLKGERRYEVEDAMRTLMRADELKSDAKLMADVKRHAADTARRMATACKK